MFKVPISPSPVVNAIRRNARILTAVKDARHICGLPVSQGVTVYVELKGPSDEPMLPMKLLFPLVNEQEEPDLSTEHILSIYCDGRPSRLVVPLRNGRGISMIREPDFAENLEGKTFAPDSPLAQIAAYRSKRRVKDGTCYLTVFYTPDGTSRAFFVLACRRAKEVQELAAQFGALDCESPEPAWADLGLTE